MAGLDFDRWTRGLEERLTRRGFGGVAAGAMAGLGLAGATEAKKKKKAPGTTCGFQYFPCDGECRLSGACCDSDPTRSCANAHAGQGGRWVCCTQAAYACFDLDNDTLNCNECGRKCESNQHCLNGTCLD